MYLPIEIVSMKERICVLRELETLKLNAILRVIDTGCAVLPRCERRHRVILEWMRQLKKVKSTREDFERKIENEFNG